MGKIIDKYILEKMVGKGAFGNVYQGYERES